MNMKRLWVVGANSGIGFALAEEAEGSHEIDEVIATGKEDVDVRDWHAIDQFVASHGPFDGVIYSAGVAQLKWIQNLDEEEIHDLYRVNVFGFMGVMTSLAYHCAGGRVLAMVSDAARVPMRGSIAYCSSKAALEQAVRVAAREMAPAWSVNGLSPCAVEGTAMSEWVDSQMPTFRGWSREEARTYERASIPMHRRAYVHEVVQVAFDVLLGPQFLTGSIVMLTGGK